MKKRTKPGGGKINISIYLTPRLLGALFSFTPEKYK
jgi:hypothetical protein